MTAGKAKFQYNFVENYQVQKFNISRILYDEQYKDAAGNYVADFVILVLDKQIQYAEHIAPICMPFGLKSEDSVIPPGWKG